MTSTTGTKKELIDFLWEWAQSNGDWSKLLLNKVITNEKSLSTQDRSIVFDYFLQSIKLKTNLAPININKPIYKPTSKKVDLSSLYKVQGVNKLAENQAIHFGKNVTIVYGENGTGKTGYCRILKALGFSYDLQNNIYNDINGSKIQKSAVLTYKVNDTDETFNWTGTNSNEDLSKISIFNNNCVQISLNDGRNLIVSPMGFHLFNLISSELTELLSLLNSSILSQQKTLPWTVNLNEGTPQYKFINALNALSSEQTLIELSTLKTKQDQEINDKETELKNLNKVLLTTELKALNDQVAEINSSIFKINSAEKILNEKTWGLFLENKKKIIELENKTQKGIKEIAEVRGIDFYQTDEFQSFIKAAEEYIRILEKPDYPNYKDEICIYCRQSLETKESIELLKNYRELLNDTTQTELVSIKKNKSFFSEQISQIDAAIHFHQSTFGVDDKQSSLQPKEFIKYNAVLSKYKKAIIENILIDNEIFNLNYEEYISFLNEKKSSLQIIIDNKNDLLINLELKEKNLKGQIAELKDRKLLSEKLNEVKSAINSFKVIDRLQSNKNSLSTNPISRKTTEAREELIKQDFTRIFNDELNALRKSDIKVEMNFGTSKGLSKVQQKLNSTYSLSEILSEGEQKSIALAEFLTELQLDNSFSPVVFDDPVNSLDHHIIEDVSRRLTRLSKDRQVIIFTHSILFFNSLLHISELPAHKDLQFKFYNSKNNFGVTGYIIESEEEINSVKQSIKKIEPLLNNTSKERSENEVASEGYSYLRSAIELCVEHEIFKGAVKRYQKNIALTSFAKVNGYLLTLHQEKLNEIFERCCEYTSAHSSATEIHNDPTIKELKDDFETFKAIRNLFINQ